MKNTLNSEKSIKTEHNRTTRKSGISSLFTLEMIDQASSINHSYHDLICFKHKIIK